MIVPKIFSRKMSNVFCLRQVGVNCQISLENSFSKQTFSCRLHVYLRALLVVEADSILRVIWLSSTFWPQYCTIVLWKWEALNEYLMYNRINMKWFKWQEIPGIFIVIKADNILIKKKKWTACLHLKLDNNCLSCSSSYQKVPLYKSSDLWLYRTGPR